MNRPCKPIALALFAASLLAACTPSTPDPQAAGDTCGAQALQHLVGQPADSATPADRPGPVRVVPHDGMVTMDHAPRRLNIGLDDEGRIGRVWCG